MFITWLPPNYQRHFKFSLSNSLRCTRQGKIIKKTSEDLSGKGYARIIGERDRICWQTFLLVTSLNLPDYLLLSVATITMHTNQILCHRWALRHVIFTTKLCCGDISTKKVPKHIITSSSLYKNKSVVYLSGFVVSYRWNWMFTAVKNLAASKYDVYNQFVLTLKCEISKQIDINVYLRVAFCTQKKYTYILFFLKVKRDGVSRFDSYFKLKWMLDYYFMRRIHNHFVNKSLTSVAKVLENGESH